MYKIIANKKFLFGLAALALITLIYSFLPKKITTPSLISSIPTDKATKVSVFDPLKLTFDQQISLDLLKISSSPEENWELEQVNPSIIILKHKQFLITNQLYALTIYYNDKIAANLTFTTKAEQNDPRYLQTVQAKMDRDYPIATKLPYNSDLYRVVYSGPMILEITIKNPNITPEKAFSEIRAWVTSVGGDANAHKYVISDKPLPSPTPLSPSSSNLKSGSPSPTPFDWSTLKDDGT